MKVGAKLPQGEQGSVARGNLIKAAKQAEENKFDSTWVFERLLWPTNPQTPYPTTRRKAAHTIPASHGSIRDSQFRSGIYQYYWVRYVSHRHIIP
ncbi:MAG: hypothetical protein WCA39_15575 [Nitrososphaeraceae archaeon]